MYVIEILSLKYIKERRIKSKSILKVIEILNVIKKVMYEIEKRKDDGVIQDSSEFRKSVGK